MIYKHKRDPIRLRTVDAGYIFQVRQSMFSGTHERSVMKAKYLRITFDRNENKLSVGQGVQLPSFRRQIEQKGLLHADIISS